jgi:hypothetical protein
MCQRHVGQLSLVGQGSGLGQLERSGGACAGRKRRARPSRPAGPKWLRDLGMDLNAFELFEGF